MICPDTDRPCRINGCGDGQCYRCNYHEKPHDEQQGHAPLAGISSSVSFSKWKRAMRKEQLYYPALKFQKIREDYLEHYWREGYTPIDACNDILTAV